MKPVIDPFLIEGLKWNTAQLFPCYLHHGAFDVCICVDFKTIVHLSLPKGKN